MSDVSRRSFLRTAVAAAGAAAIPTAAAGEQIASIAGLAGTIAPRAEHPWRFWSTYDQETYYDPCDTIEEAIANAKREGYSHIARCQQQDYDLEIPGWRIREMLVVVNEEKIGEAEFPSFSPEAEADLEQMIAATLRAWADKHKIDMTAWSFAATEDLQNVPLDEEGGEPAKVDLSPKELARSFSVRAPIGTPCIYYPIRPFAQSEAEHTRIRSEAWALGHGAVVVMIEGRSGGVSIDHLVFEGAQIP